MISNAAAAAVSPSSLTRGTPRPAAAAAGTPPARGRGRTARPRGRGSPSTSRRPTPTATSATEIVASSSSDQRRQERDPQRRHRRRRGSVSVIRAQDPDLGVRPPVGSERRQPRDDVARTGGRGRPASRQRRCRCSSDIRPIEHHEHGDERHRQRHGQRGDDVDGEQAQRRRRPGTIAASAELRQVAAVLRRRGRPGRASRAASARRSGRSAAHRGPSGHRACAAARPAGDALTDPLIRCAATSDAQASRRPGDEHERERGERAARASADALAAEERPA